MTLGEKIKKLRRDADMTQETLAEYVGVSVSAVSQWETGRIMPDIMQIPVLANMFDVTTDYLLGVDIEAKEKQIEEISAKAEDLYTRGYINEGDEILLDGLKQFPNSFRLMGEHLHCLFFKYHESSGEEREKNYQELTALGHKIIAECTDHNIRDSAIHTLILVYPCENEYKKAEELANELPHYTTSKPFIYKNISRGSDLYDTNQRILSTLLSELCHQILTLNVTLDNGEKAYSPEEAIEVNKKGIALLDFFFENGDYGFYNDCLQTFHRNIGILSCDLGDTASALKHLAKAADSAVYFDTKFQPLEEHTSLLLRGHADGTYSSSNSENNSLELLNYLRTDRFAKLHDTPEFAEITRRLSEVAAKR